MAFGSGRPCLIWDKQLYRVSPIPQAMISRQGSSLILGLGWNYLSEVQLFSSLFYWKHTGRGLLLFGISELHPLWAKFRNLELLADYSPDISTWKIDNLYMFTLKHVWNIIRKCLLQIFFSLEARHQCLESLYEAEYITLNIQIFSAISPMIQAKPFARTFTGLLELPLLVIFHLWVACSAVVFQNRSWYRLELNRRVKGDCSRP